MASPKVNSEKDVHDTLSIKRYGAGEGRSLAARRKAGRPSDFMPERTAQVSRLRRAGLSLSEIAEVFGVEVNQLYFWGAKHPEFLVSLKLQEGDYDDRIEMTLGEKAMQGDVHAARYWLQNRRYGKWRERKEVDLSGEIGVNVELTVRERALAALTLLQEAANGVVIEGDKV